MKRAYIIFSAVVAVGAGGLGAMTLLPSSGAQAVAEAACPITVKKAMGKVSGVSSVDVDFQAKTAKVTFDPERTTESAIASASTNAGYPAKIAAAQ